eukprot:gene6847-13869_t
MCGRIRCCSSHKAITDVCKTNRWHQEKLYKPTENLSPGNSVPVLLVTENTGDKEIRTMTWGLVPSFISSDTEKPEFFKMYNARSESLLEKPSFKHLISRRRCVVIIDGYYEWKVEAGKKQPYYLYFADNRPMTVAGLYDIWKSDHFCNDEKPNIFYTVTMLTGPSSPTIQCIHIRQPVILNDDLIDTWLYSKKSYEELYEMIKIPYSQSNFVYHPVHPRMNKGEYQGDDCSKPIQLFPSISAFYETVKGRPGSPPCKPHKSQQLTGNTKMAFKKVSEDSTSFDANININGNTNNSNNDCGCCSGDLDGTLSSSTSREDISELLEAMVSNVQTISSSASETRATTTTTKVEANMDVDVNTSSGYCLCPLCGSNLSHLNDKDRNVHAYSCDGMGMSRSKINSSSEQDTQHTRDSEVGVGVGAGSDGNNKKRCLLSNTVDEHEVGRNKRSNKSSKPDAINGLDSDIDPVRVGTPQKRARTHASSSSNSSTRSPSTATATATATVKKGKKTKFHPQAPVAKPVTAYFSNITAPAASKASNG